MSLFSLLVISGLIAAVAFFLAGFLLRSPRRGSVDLGTETRKREALAGEQLRGEQKLSEAALAQAKAECEREEKRRGLAERERDSARAEAERLSVK
jgi:hypothetical protein